MKKGLWMAVLVGAFFSLALPAVVHASTTTTTANGTVAPQDDIPPVWGASPLDDPPVWSVHPLDDPPVWSASPLDDPPVW